MEPDNRTDELAHAVIGAAIEVHRHLEPGFLEGINEEALCLELADAGIQIERQKEIEVIYKGSIIGKHRLDLLVGGKLIVELKTVEALATFIRRKSFRISRPPASSLGC